MSGMHPNGMRQRDERAHAVIQDAIDRGFLASGADYVVAGLPNHETANQSRLSIGRGLTHFGFARAVRVIDEAGSPCFRACADENAPHGVSFRLLTKNSARAHLAVQTRGDPAKLKYNPFQRNQTPRYDDDGRLQGR